jgi:hypothetical protein
LLQDLSPGTAGSFSANSFNNVYGSMVSLGDKIFLTPRVLSYGLEIWAGKFSFAVPPAIKEATVLIYPNPLSNEGRLVFNLLNTEKIQWTLMDGIGRVFQKEEKIFQPGITSTLIDAKLLPQGIYYINVFSPSFQRSLKFIKH